MRTLATVRFLGDDLDPSFVTGTLSITPSASHRRDEAMPRYSERKWQRGFWGLDSDLSETASVEEHVAHLLDRIGPRESAIRRIVEGGAVGELYVSCFEPPGNATVLLHPESLGRLSSLGLTLLISVYCEELADNDSL